MGLDYTSAIKITALFDGQGINAAKRGVVELKGEASGMIEGFKGAKEALEGLVAALAIEKLAEWAKGILDLGENLLHLSEKTGIGIQTLSNLKTAAALNGVAFEQLEGGLRKFEVAIANATHGNREAEGAFKAVGISLRDLRTNSPDKILGELAGRFAEMKNGPEKAAIAVRLFGRTGSDLVPLLNEMGEGLGNVGVKISDDFAGRAKQFNDSLTLMGVKAQQLGVDLLGDLLPALQDIMNAFSGTDENKGSKGAITWVDYLGEALRTLAASGAEAAMLLKESFYVIRDVIMETVDSVKFLAKEIYDLGFLGDAMGAFFKRDAAGVRAAIKNYKDAASKDFADLYTEAGKRGDRFIDETKANWKKMSTELAALQKNSLMFGVGTAAEIKARQERETKPPGKNDRTGTPDEGLDTEQQKAIEAVQARIAKIQAETRSVNDSNAAKSIAVELAEMESKKINHNSAAYEELRKKLIAVTYAREVGKEQQTADKFLEKEKDQVEIQALALDQYHMTTAEFKKLTDARKLDLQIAEQSKHMTAEGKQAMLEAGEAVKKLQSNLIDLQEAEKHSIGEGATQWWHDFAEAARDTAAQTKQVLTDAFKGAEDAFVQFVHTGKISFASLATAIEDDLLRIAFRRAILGLGSALFGGAAGAGALAGGGEGAAGVAFAANGGVMTNRGMAPLRKYARGGIASTPQLAVFGEGSRPEAYVPLPRRPHDPRDHERGRRRRHQRIG
jgi:lambda family phage tail tape measure protein